MKRKILGFFSILAALVFLGCPTPVTDTPADKTITLLAIPGVTAPGTGAAPVITAIDTTQYTGVITWSPAHGAFAASTEYTAIFALSPKAGFTLKGVAADSFTVAGATVTHGANSGTVVAVFPLTSAATITLLPITGVTAPVTGAIPVTTTIDTAQYAGTISWSPTAGTFAASTVYTANIALTAKTGWTLTGVAANSFTIEGATVTHEANSGTIAAEFPATSAATITLLAIPGVTAPVTGDTPVTTAIDTAQYTGTISWSPTGGPFAASTVYTATIALTAKTGWTLTGVSANSFTVAGAMATNAANSGAVAAVFPSTSATTINLLTIPGVTAPVRGAAPVTTLINTAQYTGTITWIPVHGTFAASTVYTAIIALSPKAGFTLTGIAADSFTVEGAVVTHGANSGTVVSVFPATSAATITLLAIPDVTAPVRGAAPVTTAIDTAQYTGTISWSPTAGTFAASTVYTANIALTAKTGWTLTGVAANSFTVEGAVVTHGVNSGTVVAVFPATSAAAITLLAIPDVTAPVRGVAPVTTAINTAQYTGTISWSPTAGTFAASTVYTANIALTAKTGWTLTGVAANSFTVEGANVTHMANFGTIAAVFPATSAATITLLAIPGVTAPVTGATPVITAVDTAQYTGTISWFPSAGTFAASMVYTANLVLTAKAGYTLAGVSANSFTIAGATVTHGANSSIVAAVFPTTGVADYTSANIGTLKLVPAGRFQRDATASNISVITQPYRMSAREITRAQFSALLTTDPSNATYSSGIGDPVQNVNWYHAIAYCNKLSLAEGLTPVYTVSGVNFSTLTYANIPTTDNGNWNAATATWTNNGYRLPTEMEWLWAAMGAPADGQGGGTNTAGYLKGYAGSAEGAGQTNIGNYAWYITNSNNTTHPAGTKLANEIGVYDMSGNVREWCWDAFNPYPTGTQTNYRGSASSSYRIFRGGDWEYNANVLPVSWRQYANSNFQYHFYGFRVVRP